MQGVVHIYGAKASRSEIGANETNETTVCSLSLVHSRAIMIDETAVV